MWWAGTKSWHLYLGGDVSGIGPPDGPPDWSAHDLLSDALQRRLEEIRLVHRRWRAPPLQIWLSGALARPFLLQPVEGLVARDEAQTLVESMAPKATGIDGPCCAWLAEIPRGQPAMVVAMAAQLHRNIVSAAATARVHVVSIRPWWAHALDQALADGNGAELFVAADSDAVIMLAAQGAEWLSADAYIPRPEDEAFQALLSRRLFATGAGTSRVARLRLPPQGSETSLPWWYAQLSEAQVPE